MGANDLARAEKLGVEGVLLEMAKGGWGATWLSRQRTNRTLA
jgi:hypothetical protein